MTDTAVVHDSVKCRRNAGESLVSTASEFPMLASLAKFAPAVLGKVADCLIPGAGSVVQHLHQWYLDKREAAEKGEILKALRMNPRMKTSIAR